MAPMKTHYAFYLNDEKIHVCYKGAHRECLVLRLLIITENCTDSTDRMLEVNILQARGVFVSVCLHAISNSCYIIWLFYL